MSTPADINATLDKLYTALSSGDVETWISMHAADFEHRERPFEVVWFLRNRLLSRIRQTARTLWRQSSSRGSS